MKVDHIGYLVADIKQSILLFQQMGYTQETDVYTDNIQPGGGESQKCIYMLSEK